MVSRTPSWFHVERSRRPLTGSPCWMPAGGVECDARRSTWNRWIRAWQMPSVSAFGRRRGDRPPKVPRETKFGSMPATAPSGRRQSHGAARGAGGCFTWNNWWWGGALTCPWRDCSDDDAARVTLTGDGAEAGCAPDRPCRISTVTSGATFHVERRRSTPNRVRMVWRSAADDVASASRFSGSLHVERSRHAGGSIVGLTGGLPTTDRPRWARRAVRRQRMSARVGVRGSTWNSSARHGGARPITRGAQVPAAEPRRASPQVGSMLQCTLPRPRPPLIGPSRWWSDRRGGDHGRSASSAAIRGRSTWNHIGHVDGVPIGQPVSC